MLCMTSLVPLSVPLCLASSPLPCSHLDLLLVLRQGRGGALGRGGRLPRGVEVILRLPMRLLLLLLLLLVWGDGRGDKGGGGHVRLRVG